MTNLLMRMLDPAFGRPRGMLGRLGGALMARGTADQERRAVADARLQTHEQVLVVGHGPGLGLTMAAAEVGPTGHVVGVDPSETMRRMASARCSAETQTDNVDIRDGNAEDTGCGSARFDAAISVNNIMLWDGTAGFAELARVLRPGCRLVVTVHRHVLEASPDELREGAERAGFEAVSVKLRARRMNSPAVELLARRPLAPA